jgi:hypothetical protein
MIMKSTAKPTWTATAGLFMALPTAYIICISVLKYVFGINGPFDFSEPFLQRAGIKETPGWNINLLILLGPIAGFLLAIFQVLTIKWNFSKEDFHLEFIVVKRWFPILVAAFSISLVAILFFYLLGENCSC